jgi:hypothetical protein
MLDADLPFGIIRIAMLIANSLISNDIAISMRTTHVVILHLLRLLHIYITPGRRSLTRIYFTNTEFLPSAGTVVVPVSSFVFGFRFLCNFHG